MGYNGGTEVGILGEDGVRDIVIRAVDEAIPQPLGRVGVPLPVEEG